MKKRRYILLLLSVILIFILTAYIENNEELELSEEVQKRLQEKREIPEFVLTKEVFNDGKEEVYGTVKYDYDDNGRLIQVDYINKDGEIIESKRYEYNEQGLRSKRIVTKALDERHKEDWRFQSYDRKELRKKTDEVWYIKVIGWPLWNIGTTTYEYNEYGLIISYKEVKNDGTKVRWGGVEYHKNGYPRYKWIKRYDGAEREIYFNQEGQWTRRIMDYITSKMEERAFYDNNGNMLKKTVKQEKDNGEVIINSVFTYEYNDKEQLVKTTVKWLDMPGYYYTYEYKYDESGNKVEVVQRNKDGNIEKMTRYQYNHVGKEVLRYRGTGDIDDLYKYETVYDYNCNKIKELDIGPNDKLLKSKEMFYKKLSTESNCEINAAVYNNGHPISLL